MSRLALVVAIAAMSPPASAGDAGRTETTEGAPRLPEDPVAGAKATAQWRAFMADEERERKLHYDRARLKQHRAVLRALKDARARYDRARTEAALEAARARFSATADDVRRRIAAIDHWGNNSNLVGDYGALLELLADDYPAARSAALTGDRASRDRAERLRREMGAKEKQISAWLVEAAAAKDE